MPVKVCRVRKFCLWLFCSYFCNYNISILLPKLFVLLILKRLMKCFAFTDNVVSYCQAHRGDIKADPSNCARYFNCSDPTSPLGPYIEECNYPELFSTLYKTCGQFDQVDCQSRPEPTSPCKIYYLNVFIETMFKRTTQVAMINRHTKIF